MSDYLREFIKVNAPDLQAYTRANINLNVLRARVEELEKAARLSLSWFRDGWASSQYVETTIEHALYPQLGEMLTSTPEMTEAYRRQQSGPTIALEDLGCPECGWHNSEIDNCRNPWHTQPTESEE